MSQISTADRTWTGHTDTRVCVPAPPLQISTADTRCLFTGTVHGTGRSRSFVPSGSGEALSACRQERKTHNHRSRGDTPWRAPTYTGPRLSRICLPSPAVPLVHTRSSRVVRGILVHVHVHLPSRQDAQPPVPWRHTVEGADYSARDSHGGRTACAHQHNGTYLHMRCTLGCSKRCPVTGRDSAAASCVHSTRHSTQ